MTVCYLFQPETVAAESEEGGQAEAVMSDLPDPAEFRRGERLQHIQRRCSDANCCFDQYLLLYLDMLL